MILKLNDDFFKIHFFYFLFAETICEDLMKPSIQVLYNSRCTSCVIFIMIILENWTGENIR